MQLVSFTEFSYPQFFSKASISFSNLALYFPLCQLSFLMLMYYVNPFDSFSFTYFLSIYILFCPYTWFYGISQFLFTYNFVPSSRHSSFSLSIFAVLLTAYCCFHFHFLRIWTTSYFGGFRAWWYSFICSKKHTLLGYWFIYKCTTLLRWCPATTVMLTEWWELNLGKFWFPWFMGLVYLSLMGYCSLLLLDNNIIIWFGLRCWED